MEIKIISDICQPFKKIVYIQLAVPPYIIGVDGCGFPPCTPNHQAVDVISGHGCVVSPGDGPFHNHGNGSGRMGSGGSGSGQRSVLVSGKSTGKLIARGGDVRLNLIGSGIASAGFNQDAVIKLVIGGNCQLMDSVAW